MYQSLYQRFLTANPGKQHYACHSHYYWPDVTRDAMLEYWDESARLVDDKWQHWFATLVPELQQRLSQIVGSQTPEQWVFAPNTHELLFRIISCIDLTKPQTILSTDSEFHSFYRQSHRLDELENITLESVATQPFASFTERFIEAIKAHQPQVIFISQVFYNSGFKVNDLAQIVAAVDNPDTIIVVDGYHAFMACPTDLSGLLDRVFYLAGSYKYAQGGEGACFAHVPPNSKLRPLYTGWFAEFGELDKAKDGQVNYSQDGMRFAGATMDFSALFRLRAVLRMLEAQQLSVATIDQHVRALQEAFLQELDQYRHPLLNRDSLLVPNAHERGHFLTFDMPDESTTAALAKALKQHGVLTDFRGNRLRFGFALYHSVREIDLSCLAEIPGSFV